MKEKATVRYQGYRTLPDGGRGFDFSVLVDGQHTNLITVTVTVNLLTGPDRIAIQEGAGICYETLKSRIETEADIPCEAFSLTSADIAQHRKNGKPEGRRY